MLKDKKKLSVCAHKSQQAPALPRPEGLYPRVIYSKRRTKLKIFVLFLEKALWIQKNIVTLHRK